MVYDNLKGSFKEGKATDESKNQSGLMAKELSALSSAGPEGHTLAYITPEEEKLLQKATGKETITTAYGIPTYETEMTVEEQIKPADLTRVFSEIGKIREQIAMLPKPANLKPIYDSLTKLEEYGWELEEDIEELSKDVAVVKKENELQDVLIEEIKQSTSNPLGG